MVALVLNTIQEVDWSCSFYSVIGIATWNGSLLNFKIHHYTLDQSKYFGLALSMHMYCPLFRCCVLSKAGPLHNTTLNKSTSSFFPSTEQWNDAMWWWHNCFQHHVLITSPNCLRIISWLIYTWYDSYTYQSSDIISD